MQKLYKLYTYRYIVPADGLVWYSNGIDARGVVYWYLFVLFEGGGVGRVFGSEYFIIFDDVEKWCTYTKTTANSTTKMEDIIVDGMSNDMRAPKMYSMMYRWCYLMRRS